MPDHDVVIVGAGPVGLLCACLLAAEGVDVAVVERREGGDRRTKAIGIHPPGLAALDAAGVGGAVRAEGLRLDGGDVLSRGRVLTAVDFGSDRPVLTLPQPRTDALLRARLAGLAADPLVGEATAVRDEGGFVRVAVRRGGRTAEITGALVVAADGVRSPIRRSLGVGWTPRAGTASYAMVDVADPSGGTRAHLHCEPGGLVESFPLPGGARRWVVRLDPRTHPGTPGPVDLAAVIAQRTGERPDIPGDVRVAGFQAAQHVVPTVVHGRTILLGDAAHEISPIGGQGMNLGWLDAVRLVDPVVRALATGTPELGAYARDGRRRARAVQRRASFYMAMGAPASGAALWSREALIRALGSSPIRGWSAGLVTMRGI